ncbi:hypothetical protein Sango_0857200 [Sesamum angolense]|uniref:ARM repeat superfamily protein n=1 Tax=Sesamum angolense TaxID=2727404 RepID=A0AAE2C0U7_9LAMI|nr:hypothetical protein Sango_0857200 [Sesamum angolense]
MAQEEEPQLIGLGPGSGSGPMVSATIGRVMTTLLQAKPKKLQDAISRLQSPLKMAPLTVSLGQSLWFLHKYIGEAAERGEHLDQVLVPIIQHSLAMRVQKQGNQVMILLNWLFQDEILFQYTMRNLAGIISKRDDHYVALGWCILGRSLIEYESVVNNVPTNAIREKYDAILKIFCSCVTHLLSIMCNRSNMQEGFELPTRLAVAAADFILSLTVSLTRKDLASDNMTKKQKSSSVVAKSQPISLLPGGTNDRGNNTSGKTSGLPSSLELKLLLWDNLNQLIPLVEKLTAKKMAKPRKEFPPFTFSTIFTLTLMELFCLFPLFTPLEYLINDSGAGKADLCMLKDLRGYLSGSRKSNSFMDAFKMRQTEMQLLKNGALLLSSCWKHYGMLMHLEDQKFSQQYKELLDQYLSGIQFYADNQSEEPNMSKDSKSDTINFFLNCLLLLLGRLDNQQFGNAITEFGSQISQVLMSQMRQAQFELSTLLSDNDVSTATICSDSKCLYEVLNRTDSKNVAQRRNAVDIVADLIRISSVSVNALSQAAWQDVANHLLKFLGDEDQDIHNQAANLIPMIDPAFVLPELVGLIYSANERAKMSGSRALTALLVNHKQKPEILCMLLDCLSKHSENPDSGAAAHGKEGSTLDADRLLKLLPEWAKNAAWNFQVEDWRVMVGPFIDKMLAEPSNAVIVRFLSHITDGHFSIEGTGCIAALMINRALSKSEFEDVRKLASELCGRIHPKVLVPVLSSQLEFAANAKDTLKIRVCLFSLCTSLMIRGNNAYRHPDLFRIRNTIQKVLSWTSSDKDEISKAQHGCIDCLALMLCTELQAPQSLKGGAISEYSVLAHVINQLTDDEKDVSVESDVDDCMAEATVHLSFRLCMANVLISACQKIQDTGKKSFVRKILPRVICAVGVTVYPEIRAACIQVLFAVAYHLKSSIFAYSNDLLTIALKSLGEGSYKEKMAGAKLLACLMASEEEVVESISGGLIGARSLLHHLSSTDPWPDVRQMCQQLLLWQQAAAATVSLNPRNLMVPLLVTLAFSAAPLMLYIPPIRTLNHFLQATHFLLRGAVSYACVFCPDLRLDISRFLSLRFTPATS